MRRLERPVGASPTTFMRPQWSPSPPRGYPERLLLSEYGKALASSVLPEDVSFHHRWLRFEQCGPHPGTRNSRASSSNAFTFCSLSRHAAVPSSFRNQVSRCSSNPPQVLADCGGSLIVRDTAHVASTAVMTAHWGCPRLFTVCFAATR